MAVNAIVFLLATCLAVCVVGAFNRFHPNPRFDNTPPPYRPTLPSPHNRVPQAQQPQPRPYDDSPYYNSHYDDGNFEPQAPASSEYTRNRLIPVSTDSQLEYKNRLPGYPNPNSEMNYNRPGFSTPVVPSSPSPDARPESPTPLESGPKQCSISKSHKNAMPKGKLEEINVTPLDSSSPIECLNKCCEVGPSVCQYILVFQSKCMAVACSREVAQLCEAQSFFDEGQPKTGYYEIMHPEEHYVETDSNDEVTPTSSDDVVASTDGDFPTQQSGDQSTSEATTVDGEEVEKTGQTGFRTEEEPVTTTPEVTEPVMHAETTVSTETTATPPTLTEPPSLENLTIAIAGDTEVVLPENEVQLFASTWPDPPGVAYHWSRVFGGKEGVLSGMNDPSVTLSELVPGVYGLRVTAQSTAGQFGVKFVNVTVHEKPRDNTPPIPVISPNTNYTVDLPQTTVIFDASQSKDDLGSDNLRYLWQQVAGPLGTTGESHEALLTLTNPQPGKYRYKLTVTDSDGAKAVSYADLTVVPERDYPPLANAGSDVVLKLPNSEVELNGEGSTDDKPGMVYLWELLSDQKGLDMEGTDSAILRVSQLTVGVYHFKLTVTDSAGQSDDSEVTVDVLSEKNEAPIADAGGLYTLHFPDTAIVLDGSKSHDDYEKGMKYTWKQTSGPTDIVLSGTNTPQLSVTGLHIDPAKGSPTNFTFNLTIEDYANLSTTDTAVLSFYKDPKILPHVSAGPDITITLPQNTAVLNGSATWDDFGITSYHWSRSSNSPAAGIPLLDSDATPVLILSNLVNGTYNFILHVTNTQKVKASDTVELHVLANPNDHYIIQLHLDTAISNFSRSDLQDLGKYLSLTLNDYTIQFQGVYESHPHTVVEFYAIDLSTHTFMNVSEAWRRLTEDGQDYKILHYHVVRVEMKECQLSCSGHGSCDKRTKHCSCDAFWMENPFTAHSGRQESNCEWSVFYVVLLILGVFVVTGVIIWLSCWCCLRRRKLSRTKRRIRYAIHDHSEGAGESKRMLTKGQQYIQLKERLGYQESSLMQSESETEEEVLFETAKKRRSTSPQIKNNIKLNSEGGRYGKNSSLVNTVIPK